MGKITKQVLRVRGLKREYLRGAPEYLEGAPDEEEDDDISRVEEITLLFQERHLTCRLRSQHTPCSYDSKLQPAWLASHQ